MSTPVMHCSWQKTASPEVHSADSLAPVTLSAGQRLLQRGRHRRHPRCRRCLGGCIRVRVQTCRALRIGAVQIVTGQGVFERPSLHRGLKPAANEDRRAQQVAGNGRPRAQGSGARSQAVQLCDGKPEAVSKASAARLPLQTVACSGERTQRHCTLHREADPVEWPGAYLQTYLDPRSRFESRGAVHVALYSAADAMYPLRPRCLHLLPGYLPCVAARYFAPEQTRHITLLRRCQLRPSPTAASPFALLRAEYRFAHTDRRTHGHVTSYRTAAVICLHTRLW